MGVRTVEICFQDLSTALRPLLAGLSKDDGVAFHEWANRCADAVWDLLLEASHTDGDT